MKQKSNSKFSLTLTFQLLLWGLVWGLSEAILGTFLHTFPLGRVAVYILYPIGFYCMFRAYLATGKTSVMLGCAAVACLLKLSVLLFYQPELMVFVVKPAVCILVEGGISVVGVGVVRLVGRGLTMRVYNHR